MDLDLYFWPSVAILVIGPVLGPESLSQSDIRKIKETNSESKMAALVRFQSQTVSISMETEISGSTDCGKRVFRILG